MATEHVNTQVCVVGSGAGGAVVAKELAERGAHVLLLEEGPRVRKEDFTSRVLDAFSLVYRDNAMTGIIGRPAIPLPLGRCVGGSTVVNNGSCYRPPRRFFRDCEALGLSSFAQEVLTPHFERAESFLNVHPVEPHLLGGNAHAIAGGADRLGLPWRPIPRAHRDCQGCGHCSLGCPKDAKQAMHITYIPKAEELGAKVFSQWKAMDLLIRRGRVVSVRGVRLAAGGGAEGEFEILADAVVLAAGAIHTPILLLRNRVGTRSGQTGQNLHIHPVARVRGVFDEAIDGWRGVPQSLYIDRIEAEGILLHNTFVPLAAEAASLPGFGREHWELVRRYRNMAAVVVHLADRNSGRVALRHGGQIEISYRLGSEEVERLINGIVLAARILFAAGARMVVLPVRFHEIVRHIDELESLAGARTLPSQLKLAAFHPHGTCRMGVNPHTSVVDDSFRVHGVEGLYLADASAIPTALDVSPQLTIMAFASRAAQQIAEQI